VPALPGQPDRGADGRHRVARIYPGPRRQAVTRGSGRDDKLAARADPGQRGPQPTDDPAQRGRPRRRQLAGPDDRGQPFGRHRALGKRQGDKGDPGPPAAERMAGQAPAITCHGHGINDLDIDTAAALNPGH